MLQLLKTFSLAVVLTTFFTANAMSQRTEAYPGLKAYLDARIEEFTQISVERKSALEELAKYVSDQKIHGKQARLTFICTHNSRRSHMSQIWSAVAADYYKVDGIQTFSGGTEATAFNPRAIAALRRAGLNIEQISFLNNPQYSIRFTKTIEPLVCFSKVYNQSPNPKTDFCAVMTCSDADKACPVVDGCNKRVAIPYEDPKIADNTPAEADKYDERSRQICREMMYLFSQVK